MIEGENPSPAHGTLRFESIEAWATGDSMPADKITHCRVAVGSSLDGDGWNQVGKVKRYLQGNAARVTLSSWQTTQRALEELSLNLDSQNLQQKCSRQTLPPGTQGTLHVLRFFLFSWLSVTRLPRRTIWECDKSGKELLFEKDRNLVTNRGTSWVETAPCLT